MRNPKCMNKHWMNLICGLRIFRSDVCSRLVENIQAFPLINLPEASTFSTKSSKNCLSPFIYAIKPRHKWCRRATNHFNVKFALMKWISWQVAFNSECHSTRSENFYLERSSANSDSSDVTFASVPEAWKKLATKCFGSSPKKNLFMCKKTSF